MDKGDVDRNGKQSSCTNSKQGENEGTRKGFLSSEKKEGKDECKGSIEVSGEEQDGLNGLVDHDSVLGRGSGDDWNEKEAGGDQPPVPPPPPPPPPLLPPQAAPSFSSGVAKKKKKSKQSGSMTTMRTMQSLWQSASSKRSKKATATAAAPGKGSSSVGDSKRSAAGGSGGGGLAGIVGEVSGGSELGLGDIHLIFERIEAEFARLTTENEELREQLKVANERLVSKSGEGGSSTVGAAGINLASGSGRRASVQEGINGGGDKTAGEGAGVVDGNRKQRKMRDSNGPPSTSSSSRRRSSLGGGTSLMSRTLVAATTASAKFASAFRQQNCACEGKLMGHRDGVWEVSYSKKLPNFLASCSADQTARIWDMEKMNVVFNYVGHKGSVNSVRFHPSCNRTRTVCTSSGDGTCHLWRIPSLTAAVESSWEPGGVRGTLGSDKLPNRSLDDLSLGFGRPLSSTNHGGQSSQGSMFVRQRSVPSLFSGSVNGDDINCNGSKEKVPSVGRRGKAEQKEKQTGLNCPAPRKGFKESGEGDGGSEKENSWPVQSTNSSSSLWNAAQFITSPTMILRGHEDVISAAEWNSSGEKVITGAWDRSVKLWDCESGSCIQTLIGHDEEITNVNVHKSEQLATSTSEDSTFRLWDFRIPSQYSVNVFQGHSQTVRTAIFSESRNLVISGGDDRTVKVWDLKNMSSALMTIRLSSKVNRLALSNDGNLLALPLDDCRIRIHSLNGSRVSTCPQTHHSMVSSVAWCYDDKVLVSSSFDSLILKWDMTNIA
eukprot:Nk52_evm51s2118 gene=Nk52_evmTU51s2118